MAMWSKRIISYTFLLFYLACSSAAFAADSSVVLTKVRYGEHKDRIRLVLDFQGKPSYGIYYQEKGAVSLSIPHLDTGSLPADISSSGFPGWIEKVAPEESKGRPGLIIYTRPGVSVLDHGLIQEPPPQRIFLDFTKEPARKENSKKSSVKQQPKKNVQSKAAPAKKGPEIPVEKANQPQPLKTVPVQIVKSESPPPAPAKDDTTSVKLEQLKHDLLSDQEKGTGSSPGQPPSEKKPDAAGPAKGEVKPDPGKKPSAEDLASVTKPAPPQTTTRIIIGGSAEAAETPQEPTSEIRNRITKKIGAYRKLSAAETEQKILLDQVLVSFEEKDFAKAQLLLDEFIRRYPQSTFAEQASYLKGHILYELKRKAPLPEKQETISSYIMALASFPDSPEAPQALYNMGRVYLEMSFYYEALAQFKQLASGYPETRYGKEAEFWIGESNFQMGKFKEALALFQQFLRSQPDGALTKRATVRTAECYARLNQPAEADRILKDAYDKWPDLMSYLTADSFANLADHYIGQKKFAVAEDMLLLGVNVFPDDPLASKMLLQLAEVYSKQSDFAEAGAVHYILLQRYPESEEASWSRLELADLGAQDVKLDLPQFGEAVQSYRKPLKTLLDLAKGSDYPVRERSLYRLAHYYSKHGDPYSALNTYKRLVFEFPKTDYRAKVDADALAVMERILSDAVPATDCYRVVKAYETAFHPAGFALKGPSAMFRLGECYAELDLLDEAIALCQRALDHTGEKSPVRRQILARGAEWNQQAGRKDAAVEWLSRAVQETPDRERSPATIMKLAQWLQGRKKYIEAAALYLKLLPPDDTKPSKLAALAAFELGQLYLMMDFPANATLFFKKAAQLYPPAENDENRSSFLSACYLHLADGLFEQAFIEPARDQYQKSLEGQLTAMDKAWALYQLAMIQARLGNVEGRGEALKKMGEMKDADIWAAIGETLLRHDAIERRASQAL